jgi:hypothetical protein
VNPSEIDDALRNERRVEPSGEFHARVMHAVRARCAAGRPHDRVWGMVWPVAAVGSVVVALLAAAMLVERFEAQPGEMSQVVRWLFFTLTGTLAIAWRSTRRIV